MQKIQLKPINELIKKFPNTYRFCNKDSNKIILLLRKAFVLINICIVGKDSMELPFQIKKLFTAN